MDIKLNAQDQLSIRLDTEREIELFYMVCCYSLREPCTMPDEAKEFARKLGWWTGEVALALKLGEGE